MKVKIFQLQLTKEQQHIDQDLLNEFLESVTVKKTASQLINGKPNYWSILVCYEDQKKQKTEKQPDKLAVISDVELTAEEKRVFHILKQWRMDKANELNIPSYMVCHNTELMSVAKINPQSIDDLTKIKGFGAHKISKFGEDLLVVLNSI